MELLKAKYLGYSFDDLDRFALCHGDFHPGGVMMCNGSVKVIDPERHTILTMMAYLLEPTYLLTILTILKVIDPEFTVFAPPGLDAGSQQQRPHPQPQPHPHPTLPLPLPPFPYPPPTASYPYP